MTDAAFASVDSTRLAVASQWQLVWWAFRKHHLAMVGLAVTALFYVIAAVPGFFAINDPAAQNARAAYYPPQVIHWIDDGPDGSWSIRPYIHPYQLKRDPQTLAAIYAEDKTKKSYLQIFGQGYEYRILGLIPASTHLFASDNKLQPLFPLGADRLGRCVWSRIMQGAQISLSVGLVGVFLSLTIGVILGGISGYYGGRIDFVVQRAIEFVLSLPTIPIWLAMSAA